MRPLGRRAALLIVGAVALGACSDPATPDAQAPQLGILQLEAYTGPSHLLESDPATRDTAVRWTDPPNENAVWSPDVLVAPDDVQAGQPFTIEVTTIGDGGCWSAVSQEVEITGNAVELTPFDAHSGHDVCTTILLFLSHKSTVTLDTPGEWTIRVTGRRVRYGDQTSETPVTAEKVIVVR